MVGGSRGEAKRAIAQTLLVCAECQEAKPWTASCIHTFTGNGATNLVPTPPFERPCEPPQGEEWSCGASRDLAGPAAEQPAWLIVTPPATRRWLDTKDHRGATKTKPITYGATELEFLSLHGIARRGEARPKRREVHGRDNVFDDGAIDEGWAAKVRHPKWEQRSKVLDPRDHLFQRARGRTLERESRIARTAPWGPRIDHLWRIPSGKLLEREYDPKIIKQKPPTNAGWPRFKLSALPEDVRWKWYADRALEASVAWSNGLGPMAASDNSGFAHAIGAHKADRLLARKLARRRVEAQLEHYLERYRTPVDTALAALTLAIRRASAIRPWTPEFWATLPQQLAVHLARKDPKAYAWLAEADEEGAAKVPQHVADALERQLERLIRRGGGRTFAAELTGALRGKTGDGCQVLVAAAAIGRGVSITTFKKSRRKVAR
jgi:hypothetical protein